MGRHEDLEAVVDALAGPLTWHDGDHATGVIDGRPIGIEKRYYKSGSARQLRAVRFAADLGGRPIGLLVNASDLDTIGRRRNVVTTGDPVFEAAMRVEGWPEVACLAALDAETRRTLVETFDGKYPLVDVGGGAIRPSRTVLFDRPDRVAAPEELAPFARLVQGMAARAVAAYDATFDEIQRTHGDGAARAWREEQSGAVRAHVSRRRRRRAVVFGAFFALCIGTLLAVANSSGLL